MNFICLIFVFSMLLPSGSIAGEIKEVDHNKIVLEKCDLNKNGFLDKRSTGGKKEDIIAESKCKRAYTKITTEERIAATEERIAATEERIVRKKKTNEKLEEFVKILSEQKKSENSDN